MEEGLNALEGRLLAPRSALRIANIRVAQGHFGLGRSVLQRSLSAFPSAKSLWTHLFRVLGTMGDVESVATSRSELRAQMPPNVVLDVLATSYPNAWEIDDIPVLIEYVISSKQQGLLTAFFTSLSGSTMSAAHQDALDRAITSVSGANAARVEFARASAVDQHLLAVSAVHEVPFDRFVINRRRMSVQLQAAMHACVEDGAPDVSSSYRVWLRSCLDAVNMIESKAQRSILLSGQSFADAAELARALIDRILRKQPTSAIRIGDGEGMFLPAHVLYAAHIDEDRDAIQRVWWGDARPSPSLASRIESDFRGALDRADIVGVIPAFRLVRDNLQAEEVRPSSHGILNGLAYLATPTTPLRTVVSAHFPQDLHMWNLWPEIFAAVPSVSWISCHDLEDHLYTVRGVRTRQRIEIPPEHRFKNLFANNHKLAEPETTLFDQHDEVCRAIAPQPGDVYLIAAGFLGKIYCDIVRDRGGIAIDVGSIVDNWMGFSTRVTQLVHPLKLAVGTSLITESPLPRIDTTARTLGSPAAVRSTRDGRYNIASAADQTEISDRLRKMLRVVGHPRCASGYMATLFSACGVEIGHEIMLRDGIASWMHVVADRQIPYGDNATESVDFDHTVLCVRNPFDAIPSIILENSIEASFYFRRLHILRATGDNIAGYETAIARATASFLHWHDMAMELRPSVTFKVEEAETAVREWLARWHPGGNFAEREATGVIGYNSTRMAKRFLIQKPELSEADWLDMPQKLIDGLLKFSSTYNYPLPWTGDCRVRA